MIDMVRDNNKDCEELDGANLFEPRLLLKILTNYRMAGNGDRIYLQPLEQMEAKLREVLQRSNFRPKDELIQEIKRKSLWFTDLGELARIQYEERSAEEAWLPTKRITDRQGISRRYNANLIQAEGTLGSVKEAEANQLAQIHNPQTRGKGGSNPKQRDLSNVQCFVCDKKGHYARDCPKNQKQGKTKGKQGSQKGGGKKTNKHKKQHPRRTPPEPGAPETKMFNGTRYNWCRKCGLWQTSHTTDTHKKKADMAGAAVNVGIPEPGEGADPSFSMANDVFRSTLIPDPGCWHVNTSPPTFTEMFLGFKEYCANQAQSQIQPLANGIANLAIVFLVLVMFLLIVATSHTLLTVFSSASPLFTKAQALPGFGDPTALALTTPVLPLYMYLYLGFLGSFIGTLLGAHLYAKVFSALTKPWQAPDHSALLRDPSLPSCSRREKRAKE